MPTWQWTAPTERDYTVTMRNACVTGLLPLVLLSVGCVDDASSFPRSLFDAGSEPDGDVRGAASHADAADADPPNSTERVDHLTIDLGGSSEADELTIVRAPNTATEFDAGPGSSTVTTNPPAPDAGWTPNTETDAVATSSEPTLDAGNFGGELDSGGDIPVSPVDCAATVGSPHVITFDGLSYDMQPVGELVLTRHPGLEVQIRTAAWAARDDLSVITAVAARVAQSRVAFYVDGRVLADGSAIEVTRDGYELADGGRVFATNEGYLLVTPDGAQLRVPMTPWYLGAVLCVPGSYAAEPSGMFGDFDGEPGDDIRALAGDDFFASPTAFERFYDEFIGSWRVTSETSLFDYAPEQNTTYHTDQTFPRRPVSLEFATPAQRDAALRECITAGVPAAWHEACTLMGTLTEDRSFTKAFSNLPPSTARFTIEESTGLLEGCTQVSGQRPATTPTLDAPQVAGLDVGPGAPGQPLVGSVRFQDAENDATTLIVQVGSAPHHHQCTLSADDLGAGVVDLDLLRLTNLFPDGGHTLYVGVSDAAGNVSGYIAGNLDVGGGGAQTVCGQAPRLLLGAVPSQTTTFYAQQNGVSLDYNAGAPLAIVASTDLFLKLDGCTHLYLAGDAAGEAAVGWDNCLLVEYRQTPESPREAVWSYCALPIVEVDTNEPVPMAEEAPTVAGTSLNPPVPNQAPFGWSPLALDLSRYLPEGHPNEFVLNLRLLDFGAVGSTTDVWMMAAPPASSEQH